MPGVRRPTLAVRGEARGCSQSRSASLRTERPTQVRLTTRRAQPSRLLKESYQILASMPYVDDYNAIVRGSVDNDVAGPRHNEAAEVGTELWPGCPHVGVVRKA